LQLEALKIILNLGNPAETDLKTRRGRQPLGRLATIRWMSCPQDNLELSAIYTTGEVLDLEFHDHKSGDMMPVLAGNQASKLQQ